MSLARRRFLYLLGSGLASMSLVPQPLLAQSNPTAPSPFTLPPLPYPYNGLEPYIDEETMRFHHDKHHAAYINNLNAAVNKYPQLRSQSPEQLVQMLKNLPQDIQNSVRNNGGGHINHTMFWEIMTPEGGGEPSGEITAAIAASFGDFAAFQTAFNQAGLNTFGSGWAWLVMDRKGQLKVISTPNQDSPLMQGFYPIMGNDVWEHAYYLKYRNNRGQYLKQWWQVVNWPKVNQRFLQYQNQIDKS